MAIKRKICMLLICFSVVSLPLSSVFTEDPGYYNEPFRNQFHFSPEANWMNAPNGMVFLLENSVWMKAGTLSVLTTNEDMMNFR